MINPNEIYEKLVTLGSEWADSNAAADLMEETKKTVIAKLMSKSSHTSQSAKEMDALQSKEYVEHIDRMVEFRRVANRDKVKYDSAKVYADLLRTVNANERAAMRNAT